MHIALPALRWRPLSALSWRNWRKSSLLTLLLKMHLLLEELLIYWLNWLAPVKTCDLLFKIFVLHLDQLDFTFQIENDLLFGVHHDYRFVFDIHCSSCVIKCWDGLVYVYFRWANTCNHEGFGLSTQTIL